MTESSPVGWYLAVLVPALAAALLLLRCEWRVAGWTPAERQLQVGQWVGILTLTGNAFFLGWFLFLSALRRRRRPGDVGLTDTLPVLGFGAQMLVLLWALNLGLRCGDEDRVLGGLVLLHLPPLVVAAVVLASLPASFSSPAMAGWVGAMVTAAFAWMQGLTMYGADGGLNERGFMGASCLFGILIAFRLTVWLFAPIPSEPEVGRIIDRSVITP